jgi:hypothetical protein
MRLLSLLEDERKSGAIWYVLFRQSPYGESYVKYRVVHNTQRITIDVEAPATGADRLLEALRRCEEGRCDCPADAYQKLDGMSVKTGAGRVRIELNLKAGEVVKAGEVEKCLDFNLSREPADSASEGNGEGERPP